MEIDWIGRVYTLFRTVHPKTYIPNSVQRLSLSLSRDWTGISKLIRFPSVEYTRVIL